MFTQLCLFFSFFTLVPIKSELQKQAPDFKNYGWLLGIVGLSIGLSFAFIFYALLLLGLSKAVALLLTMAASCFFTGALHEDGMADSVDGIFGGRNAEERVNIMRDSRHGTFGVVALIFAFGLKFLTLLEISQNVGLFTFGLTIVLIASWSRLLMLFGLVYKSSNDDRSITYLISRPDMRRLFMWSGIWVSVFGLLLLIIDMLWIGLLGLLISSMTAFGIIYLAKAKLDRVTGDILGAIQVLGELSFLIIFTFATT